MHPDQCASEQNTRSILFLGAGQQLISYPGVMFLCDAVSLSLKELRSQPQNPQGLDAPPDPPAIVS